MEKTPGGPARSNRAIEALKAAALAIPLALNPTTTSEKKLAHQQSVQSEDAPEPFNVAHKAISMIEDVVELEFDGSDKSLQERQDEISKYIQDRLLTFTRELQFHMSLSPADARKYARNYLLKKVEERPGSRGASLDTLHKILEGQQ